MNEGGSQGWGSARNRKSERRSLVRDFSRYVNKREWLREGKCLRKREGEGQRAVEEQRDVEEGRKE